MKRNRCWRMTGPFKAESHADGTIHVTPECKEIWDSWEDADAKRADGVTALGVFDRLGLAKEIANALNKLHRAAQRDARRRKTK